MENGIYCIIQTMPFVTSIGRISLSNVVGVQAYQYHILYFGREILVLPLVCRFFGCIIFYIFCEE